MIPKEDLKANRLDRPLLGIDVGASLAKLAVRGADGQLDLSLLPSSAIGVLARRVAALQPAGTGLTGCGAAALSAELTTPVHRVLEFDAWGCGADRLLERQGCPGVAPYLLVSLGTGTSVLRVEGGRATRLGGTALGGGTVLGLGAALTGCASYPELCELASRGRRGNVDLLVSDIYRAGEIPLPGETTAACFGNLARRITGEDPSGRRSDGDGDRNTSLSTAGLRSEAGRDDLAHAVMGLIAENVALICGGLATSANISRIVYGGATLLDNPALCDILLGVSLSLGHRPTLLADGGFAGAVGALELAVRDAAPRERG